MADDARWVSAIAFALQCWDFFSGLALSAEMWFNADVLNNVLRLTAAVGSNVFKELPYASNLYFASTSKRRVQSNKCANDCH